MVRRARDPSYYETLGVPVDATADEIKRTYRRRLRHTQKAHHSRSTAGEHSVPASRCSRRQRVGGRCDPASLFG